MKERMYVMAVLPEGFNPAVNMSQDKVLFKGQECELVEFGVYDENKTEKDEKVQQFVETVAEGNYDLDDVVDVKKDAREILEETEIWVKE